MNGELDTLHEVDLDATELRALRQAVEEADAQVARGDVVEHERVREWLAKLARGADEPPPEPPARS